MKIIVIIKREYIISISTQKSEYICLLDEIVSPYNKHTCDCMGLEAATLRSGSEILPTEIKK
jgi:hypothetical protein